MLCPAVWISKTPTYWSETLKGQFSNSDITDNESRAWDKIKSSDFNHLVAVIIPTAESTVSFDLANDLKEHCVYYKVSNLTCCEFVQELFIKKFVYSGDLHALSIETRIDRDDCFCITSSGYLILLLKKISYHSLGIEGRVSAFHKDTKARYFVEINLRQLKFNSKQHKHLLDRLKRLHFNVILSWTHLHSTNNNQSSLKKNICPSTIAKYFNDRNYSVTFNEPLYEHHSYPNVPLPSFLNNLNDLEEYMEWCGFLTTDMKEARTGFDNYASTYAASDGEKKNGYQQQMVEVLVWRGFFAAQKIKNIIKQIGSSRSVKCPWASIYIQGFSDSPVNFGRDEHHYYMTGDYGNFIVFADDKYSVTNYRVSNKRYTRNKSNNSKSK